MNSAKKQAEIKKKRGQKGEEQEYVPKSITSPTLKVPDDYSTTQPISSTLAIPQKPRSPSTPDT